jgi:Integrase core domain/Binding-protein-dependent transport system inner membrane component
VAAATSFGSTSPEAATMLRQSLCALYGLEGGLFHQYATFWGRVLRADFGPSLSAFPTPVSFLIWNAPPWTVGLLLVSTVFAWALGNLLGGLAAHYRGGRVLRALGVVAMGFHPIPYYIVAFVLLIVFGYLWPVLPISGGYQMNMTRSFSPQLILSILQHSIVPALSLVLVGVGGWFMGMRALVSNIVTEDYVVYAEYGGVARNRILTPGRPPVVGPGSQARVERVMTDNGSAYRSHDWRHACGGLALRHPRTRPCTPRTNGKAERFIQTSLREWAYACPLATSQEGTAALAPWLAHYNTARPHTVLAHRPPAIRLCQPTFLG